VSTICTIESISCLSWTENSENRKHLKQIFKCQKPDSSRCRPKVDLLQHIQSEAFLCTCVARTSIHPGTNFGTMSKPRSADFAQIINLGPFCVARTSIHPGTNFGNNVQTSLNGLRANTWYSVCTGRKAVLQSQNTSPHKSESWVSQC